ncbi:MAG: helix-turn-helix domain-containing protein [Actinomycetota bacterium]|nr:helix-turn-helix domain-containing protein [Actinomycetota bacterium]
MSKPRRPEPGTAAAPDLMKPEQLAAEWQVSTKTLANKRANREGPPYVRVLGVIRYSRQAVSDWLAEQQSRDTGGSAA